MQQEQRWSNCELRRIFERLRNSPRGCWIVALKQHRDPGRRSHPRLAGARRRGSRTTGARLFITVMAVTQNVMAVVTRVVRLLGRMGSIDNVDVRRQITCVTQNKKQDQHGKQPTPGG